MPRKSKEIDPHADSGALDSFEEHFFPKLPEYRGKKYLVKMTLEKRLERFYQAWDASCGNLTIALELGGFTRDEYEKMSTKDKAFMARIAEINLRIADRAKYVVNERIGLVKARANLNKISDYLLGQSMKAINRELFGDENVTDGKVTVNINIPRPDFKKKPTEDKKAK